MKHKNNTIQEDSREHAIVRRDFIFVVTLNLILLGAMFGLYFWNRSTGVLDELFANIIKF